jgi:hypothetical protein
MASLGNCLEFILPSFLWRSKRKHSRDDIGLELPFPFGQSITLIGEVSLHKMKYKCALTIKLVGKYDYLGRKQIIKSRRSPKKNPQQKYNNKPSIYLHFQSNVFCKELHYTEQTIKMRNDDFGPFNIPRTPAD